MGEESHFGEFKSIGNDLVFFTKHKYVIHMLLFVCYIPFKKRVIDKVFLKHKPHCKRAVSERYLITNSNSYGLKKRALLPWFYFFWCRVSHQVVLDMPELQYTTEMRMLFPSLLLSAPRCSLLTSGISMFRFSLFNRQAKSRLSGWGAKDLLLIYNANIHLCYRT